MKSKREKSSDKNLRAKNHNFRFSSSDYVEWKSAKDTKQNVSNEFRFFYSELWLKLWTEKVWRFAIHQVEIDYDIWILHQVERVRRLNELVTTSSR